MSAPQTNSNSSIIRAKMQFTSSGLHKSLDRLWRRSDLPVVFPAFLVLLYQIMRASVPLMQRASKLAASRSIEDQLCLMLASYFEKHIVEETDHDVWTLSDLSDAGFDAEQVATRTPSPDIAAMVGAQYYWIEHHHPVMLLGYIAVLEGSPPSAKHIEWLEEVTGLPSVAFRTYQFHGAVDPLHRNDLDRTMDAMPLDQDTRALIAISAAATAHWLGDCIDNIDARDAPPRMTRHNA